MGDSISSQIHSANDRLRSSVELMHDALAGRRQFCVEDMRAMAAPLSEMWPLVADAQRLRSVLPELDGELEEYARTLTAMQKAMDQLRFMLLARRAQIELARGHLETVGRWAATLRQTQ